MIYQTRKKVVFFYELILTKINHFVPKKYALNASTVFSEHDFAKKFAI